MFINKKKKESLRIKSPEWKEVYRCKSCKEIYEVGDKRMVCGKCGTCLRERTPMGNISARGIEYIAAQKTSEEWEVKES